MGALRPLKGSAVAPNIEGVDVGMPPHGDVAPYGDGAVELPYAGAPYVGAPYAGAPYAEAASYVEAPYAGAGAPYKGTGAPYVGTGAP